MIYEPPEWLNIADYFLDSRVREGRGDRVALRLDCETLSYQDVQALANRFGTVLRRLGVRREERVVLALPDGPEYVGALFGILKIGAVVVMANPQLRPEEGKDLLDYVRPRALVVGGGAVHGWDEAAAGSDWPAEVLVVGRASSPHHAWEDLGPSASDQLETVATHRDDPAIWLFSGGTTGRPKAVVQTHRAFANTTELYAKRALGYHEDDVTLSVPKLFFGYATGSNLFFPFAVGASAVLFPEQPSPAVLFEMIARHRPTILINVPTMINRMLNDDGAAGADLSSLRLSTSAGEALPAPLHDRWREAFGVELLDGLGTAEMWHVFVSNLPGAVKPGTLGRVVPGFEVRVRDDEGRDVDEAEVGRMWVRGDSLAIGYWQNIEKSRDAFRGEWFVSGDLVSMDADGYVTYCGRGDDVMKVAGRWLAPQEVESCLMRHVGVRECAVVGVESTEGLTKPVAFVIPAEASKGLEEALKAHCLEHLQRYKHPRRVVILDDFPRTHLGKIDRGKLKTLGSSRPG